MPLCPQITNTPITVTQTADFTVTSVVPAIADTKDGLAQTIVTLGDGTTVYYQDDAPTDPPNTLREGDLWFDTNDGNKLYYYNGTTWVSVQDAAIQQAIDLADTKINAFYQASAPTATAIGDIWFDTDDGYKQYYWTGSAWVSVQDTAIAAAQAAATAAQTTADGKNKVFRQTSAPTASTAGDLWFDTDDDNRIYRWSGSAWVANDLGTNALANFSANKITSGTIDASVVTVSNINAGNISTGTLNADRIAAASIAGSKLIAETITASQIAASTITGAKIAAATITAANIAADTITATQISSSYVYAGTLAASQITTGTLTGRTVTATAGTKTITLDASNAQLTLVDTSTGFLSGVAISISSSGGRQAYINSAGIYGGTTSGGVYALDALNELGGYSGTPRLYAPAGVTLRLVSDAGLLRTTAPISMEAAVNILGRLEVSGNLNAPNIPSTTSTANVRWTTGGVGQFQYNSASSERFKENITNISNIPGLDPKSLLNIPVRAFSYKSDYLSSNDDRYDVMVPGFIAEEVDSVYPIAVDYEVDGPITWNERYIIPGMLALIQDLYKEIQTLKGNNG